MKTHTFLFCLLLFCFVAHSQTPPQLPDLIPLSPEAAGLGKYGDIPVSAYTGTPGISIPLYTVRSGALTLPIELNYHATGIKVDQESTWVGLGWNLIAGGAISYVPVGASDQKALPTTKRPWSEWATFFQMFPYPFKTHEEGYQGWGCVTPDPSSRTPGALITSMLTGWGEPDVYTVNFLNYSFKFFFHPNTGKPFFVGGKNKCKIEKSSATSWMITGEDGTRYYFTEAEFCGNKIYPGTWYLTGILNPEGNAIQLRYKTYGTTELLPSLSESYFTNIYKRTILSPSNGCAAPDPQKVGGDKNLYTDDTYKIDNKYLYEIETENEIIRFVHGTRSDIKGASRKLDTLLVYNKITSQYIRKYSFSYNYFDSHGGGGDYLGENNFWQEHYGSIYPVEVRTKRLKLDSLLEIGKNNERGKTHSFKYEEQFSLPYKTSFARDLWGFYNGQSNASTITGGGYTLLPTVWQVMLHSLDLFATLPVPFAALRGANRFTSRNYITAGMLKEIKYPTGGRTVFEYEPHTFKGRYKYFAIEDAAKYTERKTPSAIDFNDPNTTSGFGFTVNVGTFIDVAATIYGRGSNPTITYSASQLASAYIKIIGSSAVGGYFEKTYQLKPEEYSEFDNTHLKQWQEAIFFNPGSYSMICHFPDALGPQPSGTAATMGSVNYTDFNKVAIDTMESTGGGVRIKKVTDYSSSNIVASSKMYTYVKEDNSTSSGLQMSPLKYYKKQTIRTGGADGSGVCMREFDVYNLSGSSSIPLSSTPNGNYVGYDRVSISSTGNEVNNGKEIQYFQNVPATTYFEEIPVFDNNNGLTNGNVKQKVYLKATGDTVKVENYQYIANDTEWEIINAKAEDLYEGPTGLCGQVGNTLAYNGRFWLSAYPSASSWVVVNKQEDVLYDGSNKIKTVKEFSYNIGNYQQTEIKEQLSSGRTKYTRAKYPEDFKVDNVVYSEMVGVNNISPLVEQKVSVTDINGVERLQQTLKNNYTIFNGKIFLGSIQAAKENAPLEDRIIFHKRDNVSNILEQSKANDTHQSFIWDYNKTYPIAKVLNASYDQVAYTSFEANETGNWTTNGSVLSNGGITGNKSFNGTLAKSLNIAGDYIVTLWCNLSSTATVNGTTGTTLITRGNWKLFFWKLSNASNVQVQGTNIDEVRLYPANALMTTYTYEPSIGMISSFDDKNQLTYYEYDGFGRLKRVKDQDGKILKQYDYQYQKPVTQ